MTGTRPVRADYVLTSLRIMNQCYSIFKVPLEATHRFDDLVIQAQTDFARFGASRFRILRVVSNPCEYRVEIIFASELKFREFEKIDEGAIISEAWKQTKDCAVQTES